jgi:Ca2+/Na+ antiporter
MGLIHAFYIYIYIYLFIYWYEHVVHVEPLDFEGFKDALVEIKETNISLLISRTKMLVSLISTSASTLKDSGQ